MIAALALSGTLAAAPTPPTDDYGPASLTRLSEPDVRAMFSKNLIIRQGAAGHAGSISDQFTSKGLYFQSGKNAPRRGSYTIRGDLVCVDEGLGRAENCRGFYRSPNGELWETLLPNDSHVVVALVRIQVEQNADTLKGM